MVENTEPFDARQFLTHTYVGEDGTILCLLEVRLCTPRTACQGWLDDVVVSCGGALKQLKAGRSAQSGGVMSKPIWQAAWRCVGSMAKVNQTTTKFGGKLDRCGARKWTLRSERSVHNFADNVHGR